MNSENELPERVPRSVVPTEVASSGKGASGPPVSPSVADSTDSAESTDSVGDLTGRVIDGRIEIREKLGEGGMGAVYRAWHTLMKKDLAFKVLHPEISKMPQLAERFQREAQSTSRLDHPGVVRINDFGRTEDGLLFLVMEYISGRSLADIIETEPLLPIPRVLDIAKQVCLALDHAHNHGIVHRDLKPENVMVIQEQGGADRIKLLDFGIAKILQGEGAASNLTQAGAIFGTPSYMAPEQAAGDSVDHRADLYALGVMLFEMLAGAKPFQGETNAQLIMQHISKAPPSIRDVSPERVLPPSLEALVARALAKSPSDRCQTALEIHDALMTVELEIGLVPVQTPRMAAPSGVHPVRAMTPPALGATGFPVTAHPPPQTTGFGAMVPPGSTGQVTVPPGSTGQVTVPPGSTGQYTVPPGPLDSTTAAGRQRRRWIIIGSSISGAITMIVLIVVLAVSGSDDEEKGKQAPPEQIKRVEALLATGKVDEAMLKIKPLVAKYPRDGRVHLLEAHACQMKRRLRECLSSYEQAVRLRPAVKGDKQLLELLYKLLTYRKSGAKANAGHQQAALKFVTGHYRDKRGVGSAATQMLTRYANKWHDAAGIWEAIDILKKRDADKGVDYVHAYRQRFSSVQSCVIRRAYIQQIVALKKPAFIPLLQQIIKRYAFRSPSGRYKVKNACIREAAQKAILALGGSPNDIPKTPKRRKHRGSSVGRTLKRIFQ